MSTRLSKTTPPATAGVTVRRARRPIPARPSMKPRVLRAALGMVLLVLTVALYPRPEAGGSSALRDPGNGTGPLGAGESGRLPAGAAAKGAEGPARPAPEAADLPAGVPESATRAQPGDEPVAPYPWLLPDAVRSTHQRLQNPVTAQLEDADLSKVLDLLREASGVTVLLRGQAAGFAGSCNMSFADAPAQMLLDFLRDLWGLDYRIEDDGTVTIAGVGEIEPLEALDVLGRLDAAKQTRTGDENLPAWFKEQEKLHTDAIRSARINWTGGESTIAEIFRCIHQESGTYVSLMTGQRDLQGPDARSFALAAREQSVEEIMRDLAERSGLELYAASNGVFLLDPSEAASWRERENLQVKSIVDTLSRPVSFSAEGIRGDRLAQVLAERAGIEVVPDASVWNRSRLLEVPPGEQRLEDVLNYMSRQSGVQWRLINGVVYVF